MKENKYFKEAEFKCKCGKCEEACPQGSIIALNFPPRKPKTEEAAAAAPQAAPKAAPATPEAPKAEA